MYTQVLYFVVSKGKVVADLEKEKGGDNSDRTLTCRVRSILVWRCLAGREGRGATIRYHLHVRSLYAAVD
jgi:hypothetical protein